MSAALKERLKQVEAQIDAARDERAAKLKERDAARDAFAKGEQLDQTSDEFKNAQTAIKELGEIDERLASHTETHVGILKMLGDNTPAGRSEDPRDDSGPQWSAKSALGEHRDTLERAANTQGRIGSVKIGQVASREALKADVTGTASGRRGDYAGIVPQLRRRIRLLDLVAIGTTNGNLVPYTQASGTYGAAEVAESGLKPESGLILTDVDAPVRTIAAWQKAPKQALSDEAVLQSFIEERLRYEVLRRLEGQILAGSGTSPNLQGILTQAGVGSVTFTAGAVLADQILRGVVQVMNAEGEANAIVLNPTDWGSIAVQKASGSGEYLTGDVFGGPYGPNPPAMWGVPVVASTVIPTGTALVGDFQMGAQVFIREGVNVLISDSDQDDFIKNRVTILAEMRAALAIVQPSLFSKVALV